MSAFWNVNLFNYCGRLCCVMRCAWCHCSERISKQADMLNVKNTNTVQWTQLCVAAATVLLSMILIYILCVLRIYNALWHVAGGNDVLCTQLTAFVSSELHCLPTSTCYSSDHALCAY
jgi:hypothetical protein